ncbi:MAG TPA: histidine kinase dimerization/phospho-acceptor domain-containing protein [Gemmatimonadales bacterium]|nr:histidine kinase dimerization/phospho-acceptor domain-containing protein [Gemmatimonadales bacterium]
MAEANDPLRMLRHDLSNPLAAILAETQLLLLNAEQLDAETVGSLRQIEALARKMRQILQDLDS